MTDCVQNLIIILLVIIFIFSITKYIKMTHNNNISNSYYNYPDNTVKIPENTIKIPENTNNQQDHKTTETKEITIIYPINNNEITDNYHIIVPQENVTLIEENSKISKENNYIKEFSDDFHYFDPDEIYPSI